jgi:hypothetical protein
MVWVRFTVAVATLVVSCTNNGATSIDAFAPLSPSASLETSLLVKAELGSFKDGDYLMVLVLDQRGGTVLRRSFPLTDTTVRARAELAPGIYELIWDTAPCPLNACPDTAHPVASAAANDNCRAPLVIQAGDAITAVVKDFTAVVEDRLPRENRRDEGCYLTIPN